MTKNFFNLFLLPISSVHKFPPSLNFLFAQPLSTKEYFPTISFTMAPRARRVLPPISREEVTAKETQFSGKHHKPVVAPTEKVYKRTRVLWEE